MRAARMRSEGLAASSVMHSSGSTVPGRTRNALTVPARGPGLKGEVLEVRQLGDVAERPLAQLRQLVDVRLDLAGDLEAEVGGGLAHAAVLLAHVVRRVGEHLAGPADQVAILLEGDGAIARGGALVHLLVRARRAVGGLGEDVVEPAEVEQVLDQLDESAGGVLVLQGAN